jgi:hypothetical protein
MNQAAGKRRKRRLGRRLNHSRPRVCGGQEVRSRCCGRGCLVGDDRQIIDDAVVAPKGRHGFREEVASMSKAEGKSNQGAWKCKITMVAIAYCM